MRSIVCLFAALWLASPAAAANFMKAPGGTDAVSGSGLKPGEVGYARLTSADPNASIPTGACTRGVIVQLTCNIADDADHDCSTVVKDCPAGITDGTSDQCAPVLSPLSGAPGANAIYDLLAQNTAALTAMPAAQTAELEVSCY